MGKPNRKLRVHPAINRHPTGRGGEGGNVMRQSASLLHDRSCALATKSHLAYRESWAFLDTKILDFSPAFVIILINQLCLFPVN